MFIVTACLGRHVGHATRAHTAVGVVMGEVGQRECYATGGPLIKAGVWMLQGYIGLMSELAERVRTNGRAVPVPAISQRALLRQAAEEARMVSVCVCAVCAVCVCARQAAEEACMVSVFVCLR